MLNTRPSRAWKTACSVVATVIVFSIGTGPSYAGSGKDSVSSAKIERELFLVDQAKNGRAPLSSKATFGVKALSFPRTLTQEENGLSRRSFKRKRSWYMPVATARNNAAGFARFAVNNSSPSEFSNDPDLIGSQWEESRAGKCLRVSISRVDCYYAFYSETFDLIIDDQIVGTDFFFCDGFLASWYPRGTRKSIKDRLIMPECLWGSDS